MAVLSFFEEVVPADAEQVDDGCDGNHGGDDDGNHGGDDDCNHGGDDDDGDERWW